MEGRFSPPSGISQSKLDWWVIAHLSVFAPRRELLRRGGRIHLQYIPAQNEFYLKCPHVWKNPTFQATARYSLGIGGVTQSISADAVGFFALENFRNFCRPSAFHCCVPDFQPGAPDLMEIQPIKNEGDYFRTLAEIDALIDAGKTGDAGDRLDVLATLAMAWEEKCRAHATCRPGCRKNLQRRT
jgi:hypothetical protein